MMNHVLHPARVKPGRLVIAAGALLLAVSVYLASPVRNHDTAIEDPEYRLGFVLVDTMPGWLPFSATDDRSSSETPAANQPIAIEEAAPFVSSLSEAQSRVSFVIPQPLWLPPGVSLSGAFVPEDGQTVILQLAVSEEGADLSRPAGSLQIIKAPMAGTYAVSRDAVQTVTVNGEPAALVQGSWNENGEWISDAGEMMLLWGDNQFTYVLAISNLDLSTSDLIRIAASVEQPAR